ncbi:MAG: bifunctional glycoside hydrolase 114/ polysaccharide deacetylase family protein [Burkholderiaceae bacterium]
MAGIVALALLGPAVPTRHELAHAQAPGSGTTLQLPAPPRAAATPTGLPYGDPRADGLTATPDTADGTPTPIGAPGWSFALHYGATPPLDDLRAFDTVVVDPDHGLDPAVHRRRSLGRSELFAYVSVGEVHPSRRWAAEVPPQMAPGVQPAWGTRVIDPAHPDWPDFLVERVVAPLWARGYRGLFLDTMDSWLLLPGDETLAAARRDGLVRAVERLSTRFPGVKLVVNRGFEVLPRIAPHVAAVAAESLYRRWRQAESRFEEVPPDDRDWLLARLGEARALGLPTIAIDYVPPAQRALTRETAARIAAHGVVPYVTDPKLETLGVGAIEVLPRRILVLHDAPPEHDPATSDVHRYLAMPLHWLGYRVDLHNVRVAPPPTGLLADRYTGIVAWFNGNTAGRGWDLPGWIQAARAQSLRIAFVNGFGAPIETGLGTLLGLAPVAGRVEPPLAVHARDPAVGFEMAPSPTRGMLQPLTVRGRSVPLLQLADARGAVFDAAAITDWGGFVLAPFAIFDLPGEDNQRWVIDPFSFLQRALDLPDMPVPDPTTEAGRRLLMIHVDGDGFASRAEVPGTPFASEVMLREFVARYPVPHTISVIQGETASTGVYAALSAPLEEIARRLFAQPNVELATHSYSHPFFWKQAVAGLTDKRYALAVPGYTFDLDAEMSGSAGYIDRRLAPAGKRTGVFLWTGDCAPPPVAIARAWTSGLLNMNGGETTISRSRPSLTAVAPLSLRKEGWLQVLAPNQNENVYTNLWTGPFWGFERVIETFEMTERPRRLKPVNIYYHTYSASKPASIAALRKVYDWAMAQSLHPVTGADWIRRVVDFEGFVVAREVGRADAWKLVGDGRLRTVRLGSAAFPTIDWVASDGLAGVRSAENGRWAHFGGPVGRLVAAGSEGSSAAPNVVEANGRIDGLVRTTSGMTFRFSPKTAGEIAISHGPECEVRIDGRSAGAKRSRENDLLKSADDVHRYTTPADRGSAGVLVSVGCAR